MGRLMLVAAGLALTIALALVFWAARNGSGRQFAVFFSLHALGFTWVLAGELWPVLSPRPLRPLVYLSLIVGSLAYLGYSLLHRPPGRRR